MLQRTDCSKNPENTYRETFINKCKQLVYTMTESSRTMVQVQPEPGISTVPEAVQNHRQQRKADKEDDELGIVKRAKESDFTAASMQNSASTDSSSKPDSSLEDYL